MIAEEEAIDMMMIEEVVETTFAEDGTDLLLDIEEVLQVGIVEALLAAVGIIADVVVLVVAHHQGTEMIGEVTDLMMIEETALHEDDTMTATGDGMRIIEKAVEAALAMKIIHADAPQICIVEEKIAVIVARAYNFFKQFSFYSSSTL
jgi:hypothetical protein